MKRSRRRRSLVNSPLSKSRKGQNSRMILSPRTKLCSAATASQSGNDGDWTIPPRDHPHRRPVRIYAPKAVAVPIRSRAEGGSGHPFRGHLGPCAPCCCFLLGNLLPRLEPNAWVGIRVAPILENREVWKETHRFAGRLWVVGGVLLLPTGLLLEPLALPICIASLSFLAFVPMIYAHRLRAVLSP